MLRRKTARALGATARRVLFQTNRLPGSFGKRL